jgi:hypothetical protein
MRETTARRAICLAQLGRLEEAWILVGPLLHDVPRATGQPEIQAAARAHETSTTLAGAHRAPSADAVRLLAAGPIARQRELSESRGSRSILREPEGEIPSGHSPLF